jgi:hypothetical protein
MMLTNLASARSINYDFRIVNYNHKESYKLKHNPLIIIYNCKYWALRHTLQSQKFYGTGLREHTILGKTLANGHNKLECFITLDWKDLTRTNILAHWTHY